MYLDFFSLSCAPFDLLPDARFLYLGKNHDAALTSLHYGIETGAGFIVITGEIGTGKTTLIRSILGSLSQQFVVGLITNTHPDFGSMLEWVLLSFGLEYKNMSEMERYESLTNHLIQHYAKGRKVILVIDEAQNLDVESLEKLRVISNLNADHHRVLQVILAGQPELLDNLRQPSLRQFAQRVAVGFQIKALTLEDTGNYIHHRLKVAGCERRVFTPAAVKMVYKHSGGVPRLINIICHNALVLAYADQNEEIDQRAMDSVIKVTRDIAVLPFDTVE